MYQFWLFACCLQHNKLNNLEPIKQKLIKLNKLNLFASENFSKVRRNAALVARKILREAAWISLKSLSHFSIKDPFQLHFVEVLIINKVLEYFPTLLPLSQYSSETNHQPPSIGQRRFHENFPLFFFESTVHLQDVGAPNSHGRKEMEKKRSS